MSGGDGRASATVAVVDDDTIREVLCMALADAGYRAVPLPATPDTLSEITAARPGVVVLDVWDRQPGRGRSLLERVAAEPSTCAIPVVAMSVDGGALPGRHPLPSNCVAILAKPFDLADLQAAVAAAAGRPADPSCLR